MNELVQAGKVLEIGSSQFSTEQIREAEAAVKQGAARFVSVQNHLHLLRREPEAEVLAECERLGLAYLPFFPLASGLLTGKYRQGQPTPQNTRLTDRAPSEEQLAQVEQLIRFAEAHGHTILELAFAWLLSHPVVASVIAGATSAEQVRANVDAGKWQMTSNELAELNGLLEGIPG
jgi:aryl-alcohol dehydrogenase-like predicted oxidoreductase